jgi:hypothetical protein
MYTDFYGDDYAPTETFQGVEKAILNERIDEDGVSNWDWCLAVMNNEDMPFDIVKYILQNKDEPAIKPLYQMVRWTIEGILDKE